MNVFLLKGGISLFKLLLRSYIVNSLLISHELFPLLLAAFIHLISEGRIYDPHPLDLCKDVLVNMLKAEKLWDIGENSCKSILKSVFIISKEYFNR